MGSSNDLPRCRTGKTEGISHDGARAGVYAPARAPSISHALKSRQSVKYRGVFMGSFDTASLSTESLEDLNLGKITELLKLGITTVSFITALNSLS